MHKKYKIRNILMIIKEPKRIIFYLSGKGMLNFLPDYIYLKIMYRCIIGKKLKLKNPTTFNEKLQWLKLYDRKNEYSMYVDKFEVRTYIKDTIGEEYLIPLIGVYEDAKDIKFDNLPQKFVLKCTHDSGTVIIQDGNKTISEEEVVKKLNKGLKRNYFWLQREWPYKNVKPRIICEKYMEDYSQNEILDYKIMCFNGEAKCLFICSDRNSKEGLKVDFYDINWNKMRFERHYPNSNKEFEKPKNFNKMIEFAERFAKGIPFIRVDFYEINGELYFGELTFYPGSGFEEFTPESYDNLLGEWIHLN